MSDVPTSPINFTAGICPINGTPADVDRWTANYIDYEKERYADWIKAYKYSADQQLAMAVLSQIAQQFFAEKSLQAALDGAEKQYNIANRQMLIAEEEYQRYKARFFCVEHALAAEACTAFDENPNYTVAASRATRNTKLAFAPQYLAVIRNRARYCRCDSDKDYCDLAKEESMATVAARNFAYEAEDARAVSKRAYYDNFRFQVSNFGRGIQSTQLQTYAVAMPTAVTAIQSATDARITRNAIWAGGINSILSAYFSPRIASPQAYMGSGGFSGSYTTSSALTNTPYGSRGGLYNGISGGV